MRLIAMRRFLAILFSGGLLLLGPLALAGGASAATTIAPTTTCGNGVGNGGGQGLICEVTIVNRITASGGSATVTVRECQGAAGPPATQTACTTATITQCNGSANGGGLVASSTCTATGTESSGAVLTINQCNGSANGGGALVI